MAKAQVVEETNKEFATVHISFNENGIIASVTGFGRLTPGKIEHGCEAAIREWTRLRQQAIIDHKRGN